MRKLILLAFICFMSYTVCAQVPTRPDWTTWDYRPFTDEMTSRITNSAMVFAEYKLDVSGSDFPVSLLIRKSDISETVSLMSDAPVQFTAFDGRKFVNMRFDDNPMESVDFTYVIANKLMLTKFENPETLVAKIKHAHILRIQAAFGADGIRVMRFDVRNLSATY